MKEQHFPGSIGRNREIQAVLDIPLLLCSYSFGDVNDRATLMEKMHSVTPLGEKRLSSILEVHRLKPLFFSAFLDATGEKRKGTPCPNLVHDCEMDQRGHLLSTTLLDHHLELILARFAEHGLKVIPLKGPYLSGEVYSKKDVRPYRDIDLLVREGDLPRATLLLEEEGFKPSESIDSFIPLPYSTHYTKILKGGRLKVDVDLHISIHWPRDYFRRTSFRIEDIWSQASPSTYKGIAIQAMAPEHLFIYTALDLAINHRFARLIKFRDLFEILQKFQVDPEQVVHWSWLWEVRSYIYLSLSLLAEILVDKFSLPQLPEDIKPRYLLLKWYEKLLDVGELPLLRPRMMTPSNLLFLLLGDTPRYRWMGTYYLPYHLWRRLRFPWVR